MIEHGKDQEFLAMVLRNGMAWLGWFHFVAYYQLGVQVISLPLEGATPEDRRKVIDSTGVLGLKLLRCGYGDYELGLSVEELKSRLWDVIKEEVELLYQVNAGKRARPYRMSTLRAKGLRVSDAGLYVSQRDLNSIRHQSASSEESRTRSVRSSLLGVSQKSLSIGFDTSSGGSGSGFMGSALEEVAEEEESESSNQEDELTMIF